MKRPITGAPAVESTFIAAAAGAVCQQDGGSSPHSRTERPVREINQVRPAAQPLSHRRCEEWRCFTSLQISLSLA